MQFKKVNNIFKPFTQEEMRQRGIDDVEGDVTQEEIDKVNEFFYTNRFQFAFDKQLDKPLSALTSEYETKYEVPQTLANIINFMVRQGAYNAPILSYIKEKPFQLGTLLFLQLHLDNADIIFSLLNEFDMGLGCFYESTRIYDNLNKSRMSNYVLPLSMVRYLRELKNNPKETLTLFSDIDRMLVEIEKRNKKDIALDSEDTLKILHDKLAVLYNSIKYKPIPTKRKNELLGLNDLLLSNGYILIIPKSNIEVLTWGQQLHNCVGSYWEKHENKECTLIGVQKDKELWIAEVLGLGTKNLSLGQFKGYCNENAPASLEKELLATLKKVYVKTSVL